MNPSNLEVQVKGLFGLHKNTVLQFEGDGLTLCVSLNIEKSMKPYLREDAVYWSGRYWVYIVKKHIPSQHINQNTIYRVHNYLLNNAMIACREAKKEVLKRQIRCIQVKQERTQLKINF